MMMYPLYFMFRRILFGLSIVMFPTTVCFQIIVKYFLILAAFIIVGHLEPYQDRYHNRREMFNEIIMMVVLYHFLLFTPFVPEPATQHLIGYSVIFFTCLHIYVNLHLLAKEATRGFKIEYALWKGSKEYKDHRKSNKDKFKKGINKSTQKKKLAIENGEFPERPVPERPE